ncbi:MAG: cryptochrome/photolyase family protein, partial [Bacteroidota bacterium]
MKEVNLIFPHQLFNEHPLLENRLPVYLIEEFLFFRQYAFHKQKIAFLRATMKSYEQYLKSKKIEVNYIESNQGHADIRTLPKELSGEKIEKIHYIDP